MHIKNRRKLKKKKKKSLVFNQNLSTCLIWEYTLQPFRAATSASAFRTQTDGQTDSEESITSHSHWCYSNEFYLCYHWKVVSVALSHTDSKTAVALSSYSSDLFWVMINIRPCRQHGYLRCNQGKLGMLKCWWQDKRQHALGVGEGLLNTALTSPTRSVMEKQNKQNKKVFETLILFHWKHHDLKTWIYSKRV